MFLRRINGFISLEFLNNTYLNIFKNYIQVKL